MALCLPLKRETRDRVAGPEGMKMAAAHAHGMFSSEKTFPWSLTASGNQSFHLSKTPVCSLAVEVGLQLALVCAGESTSWSQSAGVHRPPISLLLQPC